MAGMQNCNMLSRYLHRLRLQVDESRGLFRGCGKLLYLLCLLSACLATPGEAGSDKQPAVEYQVKASLIYNFLHFITWPQDSLNDGSSKLQVCLVGHDLYGAALQVLAGEIVGDKAISIERISGHAIDGWQEVCQVVIFSGQSKSILREALPSLHDKGVLTIGESKGFLDEGGIIKFTIVNDTVQFKISLRSAKKARLGISSKLLRLANEVLE